MVVHRSKSWRSYHEDKHFDVNKGDFSKMRWKRDFLWLKSPSCLLISSSQRAKMEFQSSLEGMWCNFPVSLSSTWYFCVCVLTYSHHDYPLKWGGLTNVRYILYPLPTKNLVLQGTLMPTPSFTTASEETSEMISSQHVHPSKLARNDRFDPHKTHKDRTCMSIDSSTNSLSVK